MTKRSFLRHVVYGSLWCIEVSDAGEVFAAGPVTDATACRHRLHDYELSLDAADAIREHARDYEPIDLPCSDARHLLADIGVATRAADRAEQDYDQHARTAKAAKEVAERARAYVLQLTRDATTPRPLPLFDNQNP